MIESDNTNYNNSYLTFNAAIENYNSSNLQLSLLCANIHPLKQITFELNTNHVKRILNLNPFCVRDGVD